jgi:hypothetical protein
MAQRERLTVAEVAREVARIVDAAGNRAVLPDQTTYQAVRKQVATDIVVGFFDNYGKVTLMMGSTPLELLPGEYFEKALAPYPGGAADLEFLSAYDAPEKASEVSWDPGACITREGWAAWLRKQQYPWPKSLGVEPAIEAVGVSPGLLQTTAAAASNTITKREGMAAHASAEGTVKSGHATRKRTADPKADAILKVRIKQVHAAAKGVCDRIGRMLELKPLSEDIAGTADFRATTIRQILNGTYPPAQKLGIGRFKWWPPERYM